MIYSKTCEYSVRALSYLATVPKGQFVMISEINNETGVPGPYIAKIFQGLVKKGILQSLRGPSGGFAFKRNPETLTLKEIVSAVDDASLIEECIMGLDECSDNNACPLHPIWKEAKEKIFLEMKRCKVTDITKELKKFKFREPRRSRLNAGLSLGPAK